MKDVLIDFFRKIINQNDLIVMVIILIILSFMGKVINGVFKFVFELIKDAIMLLYQLIYSSFKIINEKSIKYISEVDILNTDERDNNKKFLKYFKDIVSICEIKNLFF